MAHTHNLTRQRDSVRQATSQVQRRSRDFDGSPERPCLARRDCCPPGKGCDRASPSSRDEVGVSQSTQSWVHRTQERWSPTNPGSASLEPGFAQAPVQSADAQAHYQMHPAPGLVCSDRPEGRLHSCFDPSAMQTVPTVCVRGSGMAIQGPLLGLSLSPRAFTKVVEGALTPLREVGVRVPNYLDDWPILTQSREQLCDHRDLVPLAPQPVGASGQLGKVQALLCAENLFSRCGVRLGEYDGTPHGRACPSSAELPEFLQRQECGTTNSFRGSWGIWHP